MADDSPQRHEEIPQLTNEDAWHYQDIGEDVTGHLTEFVDYRSSLECPTHSLLQKTQPTSELTHIGWQLHHTKICCRYVGFEINLSSLIYPETIIDVLF